MESDEPDGVSRLKMEDVVLQVKKLLIEKSDNMLLALYKGEVDRSELNFLTFRDRTFQWQMGMQSVYYQEWYREIVQAIKDIWDEPTEDVKHTFELIGRAGVGMTICGLILISEIGKYANAPDILYVCCQHEPPHLPNGMHGRRRNEPALVTLLYKDFWGRARHLAAHCDMDIGLHFQQQFCKLLSSRQRNRKLFVLIDTFWPPAVLVSLHALWQPVHMCVYFVSLSSRMTAWPDVWPFTKRRIVSGVSKPDYLKFGYECASIETKAWIDSTSAASGGREALMSYAYDVLGGNAQLLLRLGTNHSTDRTIFWDMQRWFVKGANSPTDEMKLAVLDACADLTCWYTEQYKPHYSCEVRSPVAFSSLFMKPIVCGGSDNDNYQMFGHAAASSTMFYVLVELLQNCEDENWMSMQSAVMSWELIELLYSHSALMIVFYQRLQVRPTLALTGIGRSMGGCSMTIDLDPLKLQLKPITQEHGIEDLRENDFGFCEEYTAMIDGICILPQSARITCLWRCNDEPVDLSVMFDGGKNDPDFFASGNMKAEMECQKYPETPWNGVSLALRAVHGPDSKLGRDSSVLTAYRNGINRHGLPRLLIMVFCVTDKYFDEFSITEEPADSYLLCFKCRYRNRPHKRASSQIAQARSYEDKVDEDRSLGTQAAEKQVPKRARSGRR
jgi:hypothetical protein